MKRSYSRRELYALGEPLGDSATYRKPSGLVLGDGGGGGGGAPAPDKTTQVTELPEWARPYAKDVLARGAALTDINQNPYQTYGANRIAGFSPFQQMAFQGAANMQPSQQLRMGSDLATAAGMGALGTNYQAGQFSNQFRDPGQYQPGQFSMSQVQGPNLQNYQMQGPQNVQAQAYDAPEMRAAQTGYNPNLQNFQMGPAERVNTQSFARPGSAEAYMSPYMQNVVDIQKREAQRQSGIQGTQQQAQAAQAGAFGGGRDAIMRAERERNLSQQMGDIQATGSQAAFQQAQQQFNAEQQARLQAQQANQQAGLTVGAQNLGAKLGVQQLGTQTGLQTALANLNSRQQAAVQNQAAQLQTQGMNAQQALQAALANQQMGYNVGAQNLSALLGVQQLGSGQNLQAQLANQQAFQQAQNAAEQSRQFGAGQSLQAAGLGAQYGQAAQQMGEQSRQYGAGLGMQGLQTALQSAGQLGQLGGQQFQQGMDINRLLSAYGGQMQQQAQRPLDMAYQDFLNQQNYPYKQLGFMSDMIRGLPLGQQSTSQMYEQGPGMTQTLAGLGGAAYGFGKSGLFGKEGGLMSSYAEGGVTSQDNKDSIVEGMYSIEGLQKAKQAALARRDIDTAEAIDERIAELNAIKAQSASINSGLGSAFNQIPEERQEEMMAGGGIVAFAPGGTTYGKRFEENLDTFTGMKPPEPQTVEQLEQGAMKRLPMIQRMMGPDVTEPFAQELKEKREKLPEQMEKDQGLAIAAASLGLLARKKRPGESQSQQLISGLGEAGISFAGEVSRLKKENREADEKIRQSQLLIATAQQQRKEGMAGKALASEEKADDKRQDAFKAKAAIQEKATQLLGAQAQTEMQGKTQKEIASMNAAVQRETMNKPGELERIMGEIAAIRTGKKSFAGKTGEEGAQAYQDTLAKVGEARGGYRYLGPDKTPEQAAAIRKQALDDGRVKDAGFAILAAGNDPAKKKIAQDEYNRILQEVEQGIISQAGAAKTQKRSDTPAPTKSTAAVGTTPPPAAIDMLKSTPSAKNRKDFDEIFGPGAAAKVLGN